MRYILSIPTDSGTYSTVECRCLRQATNVVKTHKGTKLLWLAESAAEFNRQLDKGWAWSKRCWHTFNIAPSKALKRANRRWGRMYQKAR